MDPLRGTTRDDRARRRAQVALERENREVGWDSAGESREVLSRGHQGRMGGRRLGARRGGSTRRAVHQDEVEVLEEVPGLPAVEEIRDAAEGDVEEVMEEVDPGDLAGREMVVLEEIGDEEVLAGSREEELPEIIIDDLVVHEDMEGGNGGVEQFGLDESLIEALIGGEDVVGEAEDGQVVAEAENNPGHDHSEVGALEEVSVSGDAPLSDTIDLTDSPGPSRCASRNKISNVTVVDISNSPITVVVISNDGKYIVGGHWSPYSAQCAWTR